MDKLDLEAIELDLKTHHTSTRTSEVFRGHIRDLLAEVRRLQSLPQAPAPAGERALLTEAMDLMENWPLPKMGNPLREELAADRKALRDAFKALKASQGTSRSQEAGTGAPGVREGEVSVIWALVNEHGAVTNPTPVEPLPGNPWEGNKQWRYQRFIAASAPDKQAQKEGA